VRDVAFAHTERGKALALLGRFDEADIAYSEAIAIRQMHAADPSNQEDLRELKKVLGLQKQARQRQIHGK
jgi:predicted RNA polymerase sigma factor